MEVRIDTAACAGHGVCEALAPAALKYLRTAESLRDELDVDLRLGETATAVDPATRTVTVGGEELPYAGLVIATGSTARLLPGIHGPAGVHTLRSHADAVALRSARGCGGRPRTARCSSGSTLSCSTSSATATKASGKPEALKCTTSPATGRGASPTSIDRCTRSTATTSASPLAGITTDEPTGGIVRAPAGAHEWDAVPPCCSAGSQPVGRIETRLKPRRARNPAPPGGRGAGSRAGHHPDGEGPACRGAGVVLDLHCEREAPGL